jgi:hypothetical protein
MGSSLTLDGGGNPDAFFVIKFYGAMTVELMQWLIYWWDTILQCFFIAQGAISVAADADIKELYFQRDRTVGLGAELRS